MSSFSEQFPVSDALKRRFKRSDGKGQQLAVSPFLRTDRVPSTEGATGTAEPRENYLVRVGLDGAAAAFPFETTGFGEQDLTRAYDAITPGNYAFYDETVEHITGPIVYELPATDDAIRATTTDTVILGSPIEPGPGSLEMWIRTDDTPGAGTVIVDAVSATSSVRWTLNTNGTLTAGKYNSSAVLQYSDSHPDVVNDGNWHHVVSVDTGSAITVYVDGSTT